FHTGDRLRLQIQPNMDCYVFVAAKGSSGTWTVGFPGLARGPQFARKGESLRMPEGHFLVFDERPGEERMYLIFFRKPPASWQTGDIPGSAIAALVENGPAQAQYEMVGVDTTISGTASMEQALYAARPLANEEDLLVVPIVLHHRN